MFSHPNFFFNLEVEYKKKLGPKQNGTKVGNEKNPKKAVNGADYQYIRGKFDFCLKSIN